MCPHRMGGGILKQVSQNSQSRGSLSCSEQKPSSVVVLLVCATSIGHMLAKHQVSVRLSIAQELIKIDFLNTPNIGIGAVTIRGVRN